MIATRVGVVGAGILGLAIARRLFELDPEIELTVLEKETRVGAYQTGHNSGVAHAGLYYAAATSSTAIAEYVVDEVYATA